MKPILIIQLQRMGDVILTYPLWVWLLKVYPNHPIVFFVEEEIVKQVKDFFPQATFFSWSQLSFVLNQKYFLSINLSHRLEAARLNYKLRAEEKFGYLQNEQNELFVLGKWQLYRTSLVNNNRYNGFHWADLNGLDVIPWDFMRSFNWNEIELRPSLVKTIGFVLGASRPRKTPTLSFWLKLTKWALESGYRPFFLGGAHEKKIANYILKRYNLPDSLNLTANFDLKSFAKAISFFDLILTPDTGPMHIACFMAKPVLNISLGNVSPWDTGPYLAGNLIVRKHTNCFPCWTCNQNYRCKYDFSWEGIKKVLNWDLNGLNKDKILLYQVTRKQGLFSLSEKTNFQSERGLRIFWWSFWGYIFELWGEERLAINLLSPSLQTFLYKQTYLCIQRIKKEVVVQKGLDPDFWQKFDPCFWPLSSYLTLLWQNHNFDSKVVASSIRILEKLLDCLRD